MAGTVVRRVREQGRRLPGVFGPVAIAVALDFVLDVLLDRVTTGRVIIVGRIAGFAIVALFAFFLGMYLGKRSWPKRGRRLARFLLRRAMRAKHNPRVYVTDRQDFPLSFTRRMVEVVGFAAGSAVIFGTALTFLGVAPGAVSASLGVFTLITLWLAFLLVPYWVFGRMGLREVDPERWLVQPMSRKYADRMRLSNGALLLIGFGALVNLAYRAGASTNVAIVEALRDTARVIAIVLVTAATACIYFLRQEHELVLDLEAEAIRDGVLDGREHSDGDFLPRGGPRSARE